MDTCAVCTTQFKRKYRQKHSPKRYCSKWCFWSDHFVKKLCPTCNTPFRTTLLRTRGSKPREYCSLACIHRAPCQLCGKIITGRRITHGKTRQFCSRQCAATANAALKSKTNYVVRGFAQTIKRFGQLQCEKCGMLDPNFLQVHHIDKKRANNAYRNLITVCANCHSLIHIGDSKLRKQLLPLAAALAKLLL